MSSSEGRSGDDDSVSGFRGEAPGAGDEDRKAAGDGMCPWPGV